jgi:predicted nucleic acid-binding protein
MERKGRSALEGARRVFGDTSYFYALADSKDEHHWRAVELSQDVSELRIEVATTWDVVVESVTLLRYRLGFHAAARFLAALDSGLIVFYPSEDDRQRAVEIFLSRSRDKELSLCDTMSYVIVAEHLDWAPCLTFDADFAALGLTILR